MNERNFDLVKGMKMRTKRISALLLASITMVPAAEIPATSYNDTIKTNFSHPISNVPGKSLVAVEVSYPPGGASAPHHHSDSAFIYAYVVSAMLSRPAYSRNRQPQSMLPRCSTVRGTDRRTAEQPREWSVYPVQVPSWNQSFAQPRHHQSRYQCMLLHLS